MQLCMALFSKWLTIRGSTGVLHGLLWGLLKISGYIHTHAQNISRSRQSIETCVGTLGIGLTVQELAPL